MGGRIRGNDEDFERDRRPVEPGQARAHGNDPDAVRINEGERGSEGGTEGYEEGRRTGPSRPEDAPGGERAGSAAGEVQVEGLLQGITVSQWEYGSHTMEQGGTLYALTSDSVRLDGHEGERVRVSGTRVEGYPPKEGDPEYLNVTEVTPL